MIHVIGIGEDGLDGLPAALRSLIEGADLVVGGKRHLEMVASDAAQVDWGSGLTHGMEEISQHLDKNVVVLATGEPMWFGIGVTILKRFPAEQVKVYPAVGAFSLAAARMKWALQACACVTIHGRALEGLNRHVYPGAKILVLSRDGKSPKEVADLLTKHGYGDSRLSVFEHMGGESEKAHAAQAKDWTGDCANLNTIAIECVASAGARLLPYVSGLEDDLFEHDGQLTKREVRAVTLSTLAPLPGQLLWDVGAGCGSIAVEWMRSHATCRAIAIEQNDTRRLMIATNAASLGVPGLQIVNGVAPDVLDGLEQPDVIFIGGGISKPDVLKTCWSALPVGGKLVANTVTLEAEQEMLHFARAHGGTLTRIAISREESVGSMSTLKPMAPVLQLCAIKD